LCLMSVIDLPFFTDDIVDVKGFNDCCDGSANDGGGGGGCLICETILSPLLVAVTVITTSALGDDNTNNMNNTYDMKCIETITDAVVVKTATG